MNIILINGKKRSGKNHVALLIQKELKNIGFTSVIMAFADPIKEIIATTFNISLQTLDFYKNQKQSIYVDKIDATETEIWNNDDLIEITDIRSILQNFGTEAMQTVFGSDVWVNLLKKKAQNSIADFVIVPDFRFMQEYISNITIKIINNDLQDDNDQHQSENELNNFDFNYEIENTGKPFLKEEIKSLVFTILQSQDEFLIP